MRKSGRCKGAENQRLSAPALRLDRTTFRLAQPAKLVPFKAPLEWNFGHREPSARRTAPA